MGDKLRKGREMHIGKIAKLANVNIQTIRFYERRNLLTPVTRLNSGYRLYDQKSLQRLNFIKQAQALGFSLSEIKSLLGLRVESKATCDIVRAKTTEKLKSVRAKIRALRRMERTLKGVIEDCTNKTASNACPILDSIEA
jgi:MerR family mercuric resistance operon transcriptional regulator/MerR family gold-responsive transcriptional activator of gol and ges genes